MIQSLKLTTVFNIPSLPHYLASYVIGCPSTNWGQHHQKPKENLQLFSFGLDLTILHSLPFSLIIPYIKLGIIWFPNERTLFWWMRAVTAVSVSPILIFQRELEEKPNFASLENTVIFKQSGTTVFYVFRYSTRGALVLRSTTFLFAWPANSLHGGR